MFPEFTKMAKEAMDTLRLIYLMLREIRDLLAERTAHGG